MTIVTISNGVPIGWVIGRDPHEIRAKLSKSGYHNLERVFTANVHKMLEPGRYNLGMSPINDEHWLLVSAED